MLRLPSKKRGVQLSFIVSTVVILLTLFLVFLWLVKNGYLLGSDYDYRLCQLTLQAQDKTQWFKQDSPLQLNCKKRIITIGETSVKQTFPDKPLRPAQNLPVYLPDADGKLKPKLQYDSLNKNTVNSVFAESMRRCWSMVGEGKSSVFNDESFILPKNICLICDQISVGGSTIFASTDNLPLTSYLSLPMPNSKTNQTYNDFLFTPANLGSDDDLTMTGGKLCLEAYHVQENFDVRPGTYATVMFRSFKKLDPGWWTNVAGGLGLIDTRKFECMDVYVVPVAKLRTLCDTVAN